jgi:hypothetical protein
VDSPRVLFLNILDGTSSFDRTDGETCGIGETADGSGLPLERTLNLLVCTIGLVEIEDLNPTIGSSDNKKLVASIHGVDTFLALNGSDGGLLTAVPVFDSLVPGTGDNHVLTTDRDAFYALDGRVVGSDCLRGSAAVSEIEHHCLVVCAGAEDLSAVLCECQLLHVCAECRDGIQHTFDQQVLRAGALRSIIVFPWLEPSSLTS